MRQPGQAMKLDAEAILSDTGWVCAQLQVHADGRVVLRPSPGCERISRPDHRLSELLGQAGCALTTDTAGSSERRPSLARVCRVPIPQMAAGYHYLLHPSFGGTPEADRRLEALIDDFRRSEHDSLRQVTLSSGNHKNVPDSVADIYASFQPTYSMYKWVFHDALVEHVLADRYEDIRPVSAEIIPTLNCTNRCTNCSFKLAKQLKQGKGGATVWALNDFLSPDVHMRDPRLMLGNIDRLRNAGTQGVVFTGGGEPLLSKCTIPGMQHAKRMGMDVVLFTNGTLLTPGMVKRICESRPNLVRVSLNAGSPELHRRFHNYVGNGADHFSRVKEGIRLMAAERRRNQDLRFGVSVLTSPLTTGDLEPTAKLLAEIQMGIGGGIDFVVFRPEVDYYGNSKQSPKSLESSSETVENTLRPILVAAGIKEVFSLPLRWTAVDDSRSYNKCRACRVFAEVGPAGDLYLCCERNFLDHSRVGKLTKASVKDIWASTDYKELLDKVNGLLGAPDPKSKISPCPRACKPHPLNDLFDQIEHLRSDKLDEVRQWIALLKRLPPPTDRIV